MISLARRKASICKSMSVSLAFASDRLQHEDLAR
jgi:hypothetical protein